MFGSAKSFSIFMGEQVMELLTRKKKALQNAIEHIKAEDLLAIDEIELVNNLIDKYKVDTPIIDFENISVSSYEKDVPAEQFPPGYVVRPGKSYPVPVVVYHLPYIGNSELFEYTPSQFTLWSPEVYIEDQNVCFEVLNFGQNSEEIKKEAQRSIDAISFFSKALLKDVGDYDSQLQSNIEQLIKARKQKIRFNESLLSELGKPLNRKLFTFGLGKDLPFTTKPETEVTEDDAHREQAKQLTETDTHKPHRQLRVFLCHSSEDKPRVRERYKQLIAQGIEVWLDEENLLPGQDWQQEIRKAIRNVDVVIVCLSQNAITKTGFVQKEIKLALDAADEQPEGTIFLAPIKLEECRIPDRLKHLHTVSLYEERGFRQLILALTSRANELGIPFSSPEGALKTTSRQVEGSNTQPNVQVEESHRLVTEEHHSQSFPIIVPTKAIDNVPATKVDGRPQEYFYTAEAPPLKGNISWALTFPDVPLAISNIGIGPAFNAHCVLHGYEDIYEYQFISWNNGPIGAGKDEIIHLRHPRHRELWLDRNDSVDGEHTLHYPSTGQSNPNQAQACLTMTYQDLSGNKFVSIFDYTPYHEWVRVFVSMPSSSKIAPDLKELNNQKKQKAP